MLPPYILHKETDNQGGRLLTKPTTRAGTAAASRPDYQPDRVFTFARDIIARERASVQLGHALVQHAAGGLVRARRFRHTDGVGQPSARPNVRHAHERHHHREPAARRHRSHGRLPAHRRARTAHRRRAEHLRPQTHRRVRRRHLPPRPRRRVLRRNRGRSHLPLHEGRGVPDAAQALRAGRPAGRHRVHPRLEAAAGELRPRQSHPARTGRPAAAAARQRRGRDRLASVRTRIKRKLDL